MKLYPECVPCMLQRALMLCEGESDERKREILKDLCTLCSELISEDVTTTEVAFERNKAIEKLTRSQDPMRQLKDESFAAALKIYPKVESYVRGDKDDARRFKRALLAALSGNLIEFGARDHKVDLHRLEEQVFETIEGKPAVDDSEKIYEKVKASKEILYVTDNAAETLFDKILIEELVGMGKKVYVAPLSRPVQDDATEVEIKKAGLDRISEIVLKGNFLGIWFEKCTPEFLERFEKADFIIAKGMGCYETLMDHPEKLTGKIGLLMKAKCLPVARNVGVSVGDAVIKML